MSQQPPGPTGASDEDADRTPQGGEPTEAFDRSPYDVPETEPQEETAAYPAAAPYGQAPDPTRTIYSETSTTEPEPEPEERRRGWVVPAVVAVVLLLVAGGIALAMLLGGDDEEDPVPGATATTTPAAEQTTPAEETTAPTDEPTEAPTTPEATEEPTTAAEEPTSELVGDLDTSVSVGDLTFELSEEGFTPDEGIEGAPPEAVRGVYVSGEERIEMLATLWPDNGAADAFATSLVEGTDGEQVETGSTYTNDTGTFWAFLLADGRGSYIWTTDRGHVLQVVGSTDYVGGFYAGFPL